MSGPSKSDVKKLADLVALRNAFKAWVQSRPFILCEAAAIIQSRIEADIGRLHADLIASERASEEARA